MARNFKPVGQTFGAKSATIADLAIQPTAAYLFASPSAPDDARKAALETGQSRQNISAFAKEFLAKSGKKRPKRKKMVPSDKLGLRLVKSLGKYKERWNPKVLAERACHLWEFADALEKPK